LGTADSQAEQTPQPQLPPLGFLCGSAEGFRLIGASQRQKRRPLVGRR